jgi:hypothetical protein
MLIEKIRRNCLKRIKDGCSLKVIKYKETYTKKMNFVEPPAQNEAFPPILLYYKGLFHTILWCCQE